MYARYETPELGNLVDHFLIRPFEKLDEEAIKHIEPVMQLLRVHEHELYLLADLSLEILDGMPQLGPIHVVYHEYHIHLALRVIEEQPADQDELHFADDLELLEDLRLGMHVELRHEALELGIERKISIGRIDLLALARLLRDQFELRKLIHFTSDISAREHDFRSNIDHRILTFGIEQEKPDNTGTSLGTKKGIKQDKGHTFRENTDYGILPLSIRQSSVKSQRKKPQISPDTSRKLWYTVKNEAMRERKGEKPKTFQEYSRIITEIQATQGRNAEHFVKIFRHESDNVAGASLGVLLGIFEIDDQSEDSKYIVNFLFSVAKNEYFCNPRRGAMESFEAALHKINVALAEIVKHGNIGWLGKFHGTIAIIEKNSIHLSATGDGRIYLFRNGTLSHISEGLSSPDAAEHPIKTFIEISSGRLALDDRLLFFLPQIFSLLDEETIERQAQRMNKDRFAQFLRTAMVNELDRSGAIIIDIAEPDASARIKTEASGRQRAEIKSYFSEAAFEAKRQESIAAALSEESPHHSSGASEYTDTKTGHIYVQGDKNSTPIETSRFAEYLEDFFRSSQSLREQSTRAMRRSLRNLSDRGRLFCIVSTERYRQIGFGFLKKHLRFRRPKTSESIVAATVLAAAISQKKLPAEISHLSASPAATSAAPAAPRIKASFSRFSEKSGRLAERSVPLIRSVLTHLKAAVQKTSEQFRIWIPRLSDQIIRYVHTVLSHSRTLFQKLPLKTRIVIALLCGAILSLSLWVAFRPDTTDPTLQTELQENIAT